MATLGQVGEAATKELRQRIDRLVAAVEDDGTEFAEVARRADDVGDLAVAVRELYVDVEQILLQGLRRNEAESDGRRETRAEAAPAEPTKVELLEQARDLNVEGRSSMSKEELAEAVEAEQSLTKEELLERAREAGVEGRSSMTKDELREALQEGSQPT